MQNRLTHQKILALKPRVTLYKVFDGRGLYVQVASTGTKSFHQKYRHERKEKRISFGLFPDVSLKLAREKRDDVLRQLARGTDPAAARRASVEGAAKECLTFRVVAEDWLRLNTSEWAESHAKKIKRRLEQFVYPHIGSKPIDKVTTADVRYCIAELQERRLIETARRALNICTRVLALACDRELIDVNPAREVKRIKAGKFVEGYAAITDPRGVGRLLRAIGSYEGASEITRHALELSALLFVRPGELRHAEWSEFDLDGPEPAWRIPAKKMKMREDHIVPLAKQSVAVLRCLKKVTGGGRLLFPGVRSAARPMSANTINAALRYMGYSKNEMTAHGFRKTASTLLNARDFSSDWIERQLAHSERNAVRRAYCHTDFLPGRRKMMQYWADQLDQLRSEATK